MVIFLIGYLYVIVMLAVGTGKLILGSIIFLFLGLLPMGLIISMWRHKQLQRQHKKDFP